MKKHPHLAKAEAYGWKSENISYEDFLALVEESDKATNILTGKPTGLPFI